MATNEILQILVFSLFFGWPWATCTTRPRARWWPRWTKWCM
jgi:Na+/H+-dicarboxylate symporter